MNMNQILAIICFLFLAACGLGGSGSIVTTSPQTQTVSGVVADGYLEGATVCIDTNNKKKCDSGEPSAITGPGGAYSISNVPTADLAYPVVVEVPVGAVDSERGTVTAGYVLTAPAGQPVFVSPLTTLVQSLIETSGLTLTDAVATVKAQLGLATVSPLDDYKPGVAGASAEAVLVAGIAKVVAAAIADNKQAIDAAVGTVTSVTTQQVISLSVQHILKNLSTLALQVQTATNKGVTVLADNSVAGIVSSSGVTVSTSDTTTLLQQLTSSSTPNYAMKLTVALQGAGATSVKAIQTTVTLPAGVVLRADATGAPFDGVLMTTGSALSGILIGKYTPATATTLATLTLGLITTGNLAAGDIIVINADLVSGSSVPTAGSFTMSAGTLTDTNGNNVDADAASLTIR
jgi:hypothetical protein